MACQQPAGPLTQADMQHSAAVLATLLAQPLTPDLASRVAYVLGTLQNDLAELTAP